MELNTVGNITIVTLTYEEWEKNPFPQIHPFSFKIDHIMRYKITGIPFDKRESFGDRSIFVHCVN